MNIRNWITIIEAAQFRKPHTMYHGTSSVFLHSILKNGIVPDPKKKYWDEDPDLHQSSFTRASLYGSYWTSNLMTAISSASNSIKKFKGERLIVIAQIAEQSAFADEDALNYPIKLALHITMRRFHPGIRQDFLLPLANDVFSKSEKRQEVEDEFCDTLHEKLTKNPALHKIDKNLLLELFHAILFREMVWEQKHGMDLSRWITNVPEKLPSTVEIENEIQNIRERLTRHYRDTTLDREAFSHTLRMTMPVKFSGSNKILSIIAYSPEKLVLKYGTIADIPSDFFKQYKERVGDLAVIIDTLGREVDISV